MRVQVDKKINPKENKIEKSRFIVFSECWKGSKTVFVFVLARASNGFYYYEIIKKASVKNKNCRFSQKLRPKSKKSHAQKKCYHPILHKST